MSKAKMSGMMGKRKKREHCRMGAAVLAAVLGLGMSVPAAQALAAEVPDGGFFDDYVGEQQGNVTYLPEDYDMSYDGALDQHTGGGLENADTQGELPEGLESVIMITQDMGYDTSLQMYVNYVRGDVNKRYYSSLPRDVITNGNISVNMGTRSQYVLYRDGERVSDADVSNITQEGAYVLENFGQGSSDAERFEFTIVQSTTNTMEQFQIPEGFSYSRVTVNGEEAAAPAGAVYQMPSDGVYGFQFRNEELGISYYTEINKDTVAPMLEFVGLVDGKAHGPVQMLPVGEEETVIRVSRDGTEINVPFDRVLDDYGSYVVTVSDLAGNSMEYRFVIQVYFTMTSMLVFLLLAMIAAGLFGYYRYVKSHLRIR